jgi:hypothetical protein
MRLSLLALPAILVAAAFAAAPAHAGTVSCNGAPCAGSFTGAAYATAHCPAPPEAPQLRGGKENYKRSVDLAKAYSDAAVARMTCIQDEANADAEALQAAIKASVKAQHDEAEAKLAAVQTAVNNLSQH